MSPQHHPSREIPPFCPNCRTLLEQQDVSCEFEARARCSRCAEVFGRHSTEWLPADEDTTALFDLAVEGLKTQGYSFDEASHLLRTYFSRFTDMVFCDKNGIPVQDIDSFHHDGPWEIALKAHYSFRLGLPLDYGSFVEWRRKLDPRGTWPTAGNAG
jgi:hypothetical protein